MASLTAMLTREPATLRGRIIKDSLISAAVVFLLSSQLVGIETIDNPAGMTFVTRYDDVFAAILIVVAGRIALQLAKNDYTLPALLGSLVFAVVVGGSLIFHVTAPWSAHGVLPFDGVIVHWICVLAALGLAIYAAVAWARSRRRPGQVSFMARVAQEAPSLAPWGAAVMILIAVLLPVLMPDRRTVDMGILVLTYCMLGWGLNVVVGLAGLLDLGYVAFYAVGAYSYALFAHYFDWSFWACLPLAGVMAATFGLFLGFPVLRLRGDYLAIVTLGFGEMIRVVLINWWWFTGGPDGIRDIPRPSFFGLPFERNAPEGIETFHTFFGLEFSPVQRIIFFYYIILVLALVTCLFTIRLRRLPIGRAWEALREDETACRALGINPRNTKLTAFTIGAMFAGFGGAFFATRLGFISPESFTFIESAVILAIVVLGGLGSQLGVVLASLLLIGIPEVFRELADYRMLAFGASMVLIMIWRPRGLLSHREPSILLHSKSKRAAMPRVAVSEGSG
jgi:branched-chain amino acid transport system permease protein